MEDIYLRPGGPYVEKSSDAAPIGTDSILLADFINARGAKRALDLGSGSGVIGLLLAWENPKLWVDCVEINPAAAALSVRNIARNALEDRVQVINRDMRTLHETEVGGKYDLVVSNPPYFSKDSGVSSEDSYKSGARFEDSCSLEELCGTAARLTRYGGTFSFVYRAWRLSEAFCTLTKNGLEPKRLRLVQTRPSLEPTLALIECRRNGNPGLTVMTPLILRNEDGSDTGEARRIYRLDTEEHK